MRKPQTGRTPMHALEPGATVTFRADGTATLRGQRGGAASKAVSVLPREAMGASWDDIIAEISNTERRRAAAPSELVVEPGGQLVIQPTETANRSPKPVSVLPSEIMAGGSWPDTVRRLAGLERHAPAPGDVSVEAGGRLVLRRGGATSRRASVSVLPTAILCAPLIPMAEPSLDDVAEVRALDPDNVEDWTPITTGPVRGWRFRMVSGHPDVGDFHFAAWRSPADGGRWRITPLRPNYDQVHGHRDHMATVNVGGRSVPVLCGPSGAACRTLSEVRGHAAKWKTYTTNRLLGRLGVPGHQVGDRRLIGGSPPSALWRRRVL
jgi:hypothetical protein